MANDKSGAASVEEARAAVVEAYRLAAERGIHHKSLPELATTTRALDALIAAAKREARAEALEVRAASLAAEQERLRNPAAGPGVFVCNAGVRTHYKALGDFGSIDAMVGTSGMLTVWVRTAGDDERRCARIMFDLTPDRAAAFAEALAIFSREGARRALAAQKKKGGGA